MREALKAVPQKRRPMPDGLITMRVAADTGAIASAENPDAILETFMVDHLPTGGVLGGDTPPPPTEQAATTESLF
jgi:membrane carboxypeptidase/penicillin-binding protein